MKIQFDPALVEQSVGHAVHGNRHLEAELHRSIDPLYAMDPGTKRDTQFSEAYFRFFSRLGLDSTFTRLFEEQPTIGRDIERCLIREAPRSKNECAELLVKGGGEDLNPDERTLVIQVTVASLVEGDRLRSRIRRELFHVADMLDEKFAYRREQIDGLPSRQNLIRDRYRVLWDANIEGRLSRLGFEDEHASARIRTSFACVFGIESESLANQVFDRVFSSESLTHAQLFEWAESPELLHGKTAGSMPVASAGGACPLCGFPTFDWFEFPPNFPRSILGSICESHSDWSLDHGACRQCVEIYSSVSATPEISVGAK